MKFTQKKATCLLLLTLGLLPPCGKAEEKKIAVVPFQAFNECSPAEAVLIADAFSVTLSKQPDFAVITHSEANATLAQKGYHLQKHGTESESIAAAGQALSAGKILYGKVSKHNEIYTIAAYIADGQTGSRLKSAACRVSGNIQGFADQTAEALIRELGLLPSMPTEKAMPAQQDYDKVSDSKKKTLQDFSWKKITDKESVAAVLEPLANHLTLGTRITQHSLSTKHKNTFLGSINKLDIDNSWMPVNLYARWNFSPNWALEITRDRYAARTVTEPIGNSDGKIVMKGPIVACCFCLPDVCPVTPYAGIGIGFLSGSFKHEGWWHYGYQSPEHWAESGYPSKSLGGKTRTMKISDRVAYILSLGAEYKITDNLVVDAFLKRTMVDVRDHYWMSINNEVSNDHGITSIPFDSTSFGIGVGYRF